MKLLFSHHDIDIYESDLRNFKINNWLNDTCIRFCFDHINTKTIANSADILLLDPTIVAFLRLQCEDESDYEDLRSAYNLSEKKWIFMPINDVTDFESNGSHWSLLVVYVPTMITLHLDSHGNYNHKSVRHLVPKLNKLLMR